MEERGSTPAKEQFDHLSSFFTSPKTLSGSKRPRNRESTMEADLLRLEDLAQKDRQIIQLEQSVTSLQQAKIVLQSERDHASSFLDRERRKSESLSTELSDLRSSEMQLKQRALLREEEFSKEKSSMHSRIQDLEAMIEELKNDLRSASNKIELVEKERDLANSDLQRKEAEHKTAIEEVQDKLSKFDSLVQELTSTHLTLEETKCQLDATKARVFELESKLATCAGDDMVFEQINSEAAHYLEVKDQVARLKEQNSVLSSKVHNEQLLMEENESLKSKIRRLDSVREQLVDLMAKYQSIKESEETWSIVFSGKTPDDVIRQIKEQQRENLALIEKCGSLEVDSARVGTERDILKAKVDELDKALIHQRGQFAELTASCDAQQRSVHVLTVERDNLKKILDSYGTELGVAGGVSGKEYAARLSELQNALAEKDRALQDLQTKVLQQSHLVIDKDVSGQELQKSLQDLTREHATLTSKHGDIRTENERLSKQLDSALSEVARLESRIGKGDFNPHTTKVLHMVAPPELMANLESLKTENQALKDQLSKIASGGEITITRPFASPSPRGDETTIIMRPGGAGEVGGGSTGGAHTPTNAVVDQLVTLEKQVAQLKREVEESELKNLRLREVFHDKTKKFREAICHLFGWKIDFLEHSIFRLRSIFAENEGDHLLFKLTRNGMDALETDFCATIDKNIRAFLNTGQSIPAFICSVTLELWGKQTAV